MIAKWKTAECYNAVNKRLWQSGKQPGSSLKHIPNSPYFNVFFQIYIFKTIHSGYQKSVEHIEWKLNSIHQIYGEWERQWQMDKMFWKTWNFPSYYKYYSLFSDFLVVVIKRRVGGLQHPAEGCLYVVQTLLTFQLWVKQPTTKQEFYWQHRPSAPTLKRAANKRSTWDDSVAESKRSRSTQRERERERA